MKLGKPEKFNGTMNKTDTFLTQCKLYLGNNSGIYDDDKKKVSYILSMMEGGTAGDWAQMKTDQYLGDPTATPAVPEAWPAYNTFLRELLNAFTPADKQAEARTKLKGIHQKRGETATDYGSRFQLLANKSGVAEPAMLIEIYVDGLESTLRQQMQSWENFPTTLTEFMRKTEGLDQRLRRTAGAVSAMRATHHVKQEPSNGNTSLGKISTGERKKRFEKRQCFNCGRPGHFASECRSKPSGTPNRKPTFSKWKPTFHKQKGRTAAMRMRSLMAELNEDEQEECAKDLEDQGF